MNDRMNVFNRHKNIWNVQATKIITEDIESKCRYI